MKSASMMQIFINGCKSCRETLQMAMLELLVLAKAKQERS